MQGLCWETILESYVKVMITYEDYTIMIADTLDMVVILVLLSCHVKYNFHINLQLKSSYSIREPHLIGLAKGITFPEKLKVATPLLNTLPILSYS